MLRPVERASESVSDRRADVRRMLVERRRELRNEIQSRVRDMRDERAIQPHHAAYPEEAGDGELNDDLAFALIQMKAEVLERVNDAVRRFDEGAYGCCLDCGGAIPPLRLRAMPFATRCKECEATRERRQPGRRPHWERTVCALVSRD